MKQGRGLISIAFAISLLMAMVFDIRGVTTNVIGPGLSAVWLWIARVVTSEWTRADTIAALSAVGSFAAVAAALGLATVESLRRRSEERRIAQLTACAVAMRVGLVSAFVSDTLDTINYGLKCGGLPEDCFRAMEQGLPQQQLCTREELRDMIALPERCSDNIAAATDRIDAAVKLLRSSSIEVESRRENAQLIRWTTLQHLHQLLSDAHGMLSLATRICTAKSQGIQVRHVSADSGAAGGSGSNMDNP